MLPTNELDAVEPNVEQLEAAATAQAEKQQELADLLDYDTAIIQLRRMCNDWNSEIEQTKYRRAKRDVDIDVEALRQKKKLDEDETLIPVRVIDTNIQREQPAYVNYLKNSRRICTFNSITDPDQDTQKLELEFTRGMTYIAWETPHYKNVDGAQTHGWDSLEVVLDDTKPLGVALEHVGHENLFFPRTSIDIQFSRYVVRRYQMTLTQLETFTQAPYSFNPTEIAALKQSRQSNTAKELETIDIYKMMCRKEGAIYVAWFCLQEGCTTWLSNPTLLDMGLIDPTTGQPKPTTTYPFFILPYRETEKPTIIEHKGRCYYDENKQEAQTAILSGYVNGLTRASNLYASPAKENGTGGAIKTIDNLVLSGGRMLSEPVTFWSPPYPDPTVLNALQYFDVANSQETNQPSFAVNNRKDSRKTATEIEAAGDQQSLMNSVQLTMFSTLIRQVYNFVWLVVQSKALKNEIIFLQVTVQEPAINPLTGQPSLDPTTGQPVMQSRRVNNAKVLSQVYDVRAAGDVDVIERQERINNMMADWPVVQNTPLRDQFLQDLMRLKYPNQGEKYAQALQQQPQLQGLMAIVARFATIMQGMLQQNPTILTNLPAAQQGDVQQLVQQGMQVAQQLAGGQQPQQ